MANLLLISILVPLGGAVLLWVLAPLGDRVVRVAALAVTLVTLGLAGVVCAGFDPARPEATYTDLTWLGGGGSLLEISFRIGLDGLGVWMYGLTALLLLTSVLVSWKAIRERCALYYAMLLLLEGGCLGVFAARDIILFYVFFEFTLIPLFFVIGIWGSEQRRYAAAKFFIYTLAGSLLTFLGLLAIVLWHGYMLNEGQLTFAIDQLARDLQLASDLGQGMPLAVQVAIFLGLFAGFAIKVPLFPVHTWLPLAHVQAPTAGSVLLAGILLKIGTYGFLRFSIPMLPDATLACMPCVIWLSVAGIIYGALVALAQADIKRLIAYSSVSHLGYCMLGIFSLNQLGLQGGTLQMINHGLSTGGLFAVVGMLYERYHTREIRQMGGLARRTPWLAFFMLVFTFSSIGLPGLNGFVGEFFVLLGMFQRGFAQSLAGWEFALQAAAVLAVSGVVLGAWYMLWLVQRVFFGPLREPHEGGQQEPVQDLSWREIAALAPLVVFVVWIGVLPDYFLRRMDPSLRQVQAAVARPLAAGESARTVQADSPGGPSVSSFTPESLTRAR